MTKLILVRHGQTVWNKMGKYQGQVFALNLDGFYNPLKALLDHYVATGMMEPQDRELLKFPDTVEELISYLK